MLSFTVFLSMMLFAMLSYMGFVLVFNMLMFLLFVIQCKSDTIINENEIKKNTAILFLLCPSDNY